jgi:hypothetical protein
MKPKALLKALVIIIALATLVTTLTVFSSCKAKDKTPDSDDSKNELENSNSESESESESESLKLDKNGYLMDDLPEDLNTQYLGQEIKILGWKDAECTEFSVDKITANTIDNSVYLRNQTIQNRLGVTLKFNLIKGNVNNIDSFKAEVTNAAVGEPYDIVAGYTRSIAVCSTAGYLLDLGHIKTENYLDFEKPWWNKSIINATKTIDGNLYFVTGDASTSLAQMTYCVYFNADHRGLANNSPYTMVENDEWTLDNMLKITKGHYVNYGDTGIGLEDELGVIGHYYDWSALLHGCGVGIITRDSLGDFVLDESIRGRGVTVMDKLSTYTRLDGGYVRGRNDDSAALLENFSSGKSMFLITESGSALTKLKNVNFEYGCVPCPKYEENQTSYISAVRQPVTLYGIMKNVSTSRLPMVTAVLECWGSEGYRKTTPAVFEQSMKGQVAASAKMVDMLEIIKNSAWFDCGRIYAVETNYICDAPGDALAGEFTWDAYLSQKLPQIEDTYIPLLSQMLNT